MPKSAPYFKDSKIAILNGKGTVMLPISREIVFVWTLKKALIIMGLSNHVYFVGVTANLQEQFLGNVKVPDQNGHFCLL